MKKYKWWFLVLMLIDAAILLDFIVFAFTGNNIFYSGDNGAAFAFRILFGSALLCIMLSIVSEDFHLRSEAK